LSKNKPYNYKGISRNIQMNNYVEYLEYIEENKNNNAILTSIANNIKQNKTSFLPQTELLKKKIDFHLQKLNELKNKKKDVASLSKNKKNINKGNKVAKENKSTYNQKYNNLITISLINHNHNHNNKKNSLNNNESKNNSKLKNIKKCYLINKKVKKSLQKIKNDSKNKIISSLTNKNSNKKTNKLNKEESNNQLKISSYIINHIGNKLNKNKKSSKNKNIFNINSNFNFIADKRKAHSSSLSKNKKSNFKKKNIHINNIHNNIINNLNCINDINKKQNTLNNIISSSTRIKPSTTKFFKKNKINSAYDNSNHGKVKIITINHLNAWNIKNKLNKKSVNSIGSSLNNTKNINKTKTKSNSKSNSKNNKTNKNKNSYNKLLTENIKNEKSNIYNSRISTIQKEKTLIIKNIGKLTENITSKKLNKNININNLNKYLTKNKTNLSNFNSFQNNLENNITDSQINLNKKRGINLIINGQNDNKSNNTRINNIIYNINRNNKNLNLNTNNNSNFTLDRKSQLKCNVSSNIHNSMKKNNVVNNQKGNLSKNFKNISKIKIVNNYFKASITSKKPLDLKKQRKIINDNKK